MGEPLPKRRKSGDHTAAGQSSTVSIVIPSSVVENAQTPELATCLSGQIARTAAIFRIDEVVIFDDSFSGREGKLGKGAAFLARILQYQETPQYLRKTLIPMHSDLKLAGLLPPLDAPHHMRATEWCPYREGLVVESDAEKGSIVAVGLDKAACLPEALRAGVRITVNMGSEASYATSSLSGKRLYKANLAKLSDPKSQLGLYWGYQTRIACSMRELLEAGPFEGGYDAVIGTSEHGSKHSAIDLELPAFKHLLIVFGGPLGLEDLFSRDSTVATKDPRDSFDMYINTCSQQGSRTIRTEEAILISLTYLQPALSRTHNK